MHEAILCRQPLAQVPYVMEATGLRVWSLEELCYYVMGHTSLVDGRFCSAELCRWIREEAGRADIADKLRSMIMEHAAVHMFVGTLLSMSGYAEAADVRRVVQDIAAYEKQGPGERRKISADQLLDNGRCQDAILMYQEMLEHTDQYSLKTAVWADVWNNLGTAYARLFFYKDAARCYAQAYRRNGKESAARALLGACVLSKDRGLLKEMQEQYELPDALRREVEQALENIQNSTEVKADLERAEQAASMDVRKLRSLADGLIREYQKRAR